MSTVEDLLQVTPQGADPGGTPTEGGTSWGFGAQRENGFVPHRCSPFFFPRERRPGRGGSASPGSGGGRASAFHVELAAAFDSAVRSTWNEGDRSAARLRSTWNDPTRRHATPAAKPGSPLRSALTARRVGSTSAWLFHVERQRIGRLMPPSMVEGRSGEPPLLPWIEAFPRKANPVRKPAPARRDRCSFASPCTIGRGLQR